MNTTGLPPEAFAVSTCRSSRSVIVAIKSSLRLVSTRCLLRLDAATAQHPTHVDSDQGEESHYHHRGSARGEGAARPTPSGSDQARVPRWDSGGLGAEPQPTPSCRVGQACTKASRSALIVSAWVVGIPCGNALYVFSVPSCTSRADSGPESA